MDTETGCGLPSTGKKARPLIGTACWFWNSIGWILAADVRAWAWVKLGLLKRMIDVESFCKSGQFYRIVNCKNLVRGFPTLFDFGFNSWKSRFRLCLT